MSEIMQANRTPEVIAAEINTIKAHTRTILIRSAIEIGERLIEAKEAVDHGEWEGWLMRMSIIRFERRRI